MTDRERLLSAFARERAMGWIQVLDMRLTPWQESVMNRMPPRRFRGAPDWLIRVAGVGEFRLEALSFDSAYRVAETISRQYGMRVRLILS